MTGEPKYRKTGDARQANAKRIQISILNHIELDYRRRRRKVIVAVDGELIILGVPLRFRFAPHGLAKVSPHESTNDPCPDCVQPIATKTGQPFSGTWHTDIGPSGHVSILSDGHETTVGIPLREAG